MPQRTITGLMPWARTRRRYLSWSWLRSADQAGDGGDLGEQGHQLGDVVVVSAGQRHRERNALSVDQDVVFAARPCAVDRAGPASGPLRAARTWLESITARDQSSC